MEIKDVENLAEMARIELSEEEKKSIAKDMDGILHYVETIEKINVDDVVREPSPKNVWREDVLVDRDLDPALLKGQFPEGQDGFLKVRKIL